MAVPDSSSAKIAWIQRELEARAVPAVAISASLLIVAANQSFLKVGGYAEQDIPGQLLTRIFRNGRQRKGSKSVDQLPVSIARAIESGQPDFLPGLRAEFRHPPNQPALAQAEYWNILSTPVPADNGSLACVIVEMTAMSEVSAPLLPAAAATCQQQLADALDEIADLRRQLEAIQLSEVAWRQKELRTSGILATAMDAIMSIDHQQRIVIFNAAAEQMFGCSAADALGTPIERFIPERFRQAHHQHVHRFLAGGKTVRAMGKLQLLSGQRVNGEEFPIEASISKSNMGNEMIATVVVRDISVRRAAETALSENEQRLRLAHQIGRTGTFDWDIVTDQVQWSPEIAALYGLPRRAFASSLMALRERVHPEDRIELEASITKALKGGRFDYEWRVVWPDDSVHWLAGRAIVFRDKSKTPLRMLGVNIDITERKATEERIQRIAQHDPLTGLPNRALLYEFAEHLLPAMRRAQHHAAFLFIDLDRFKPINDTFGHDAGDAVLKEVASRLTACLRGEDMVGRIGGDEFVAVLANIHNADDAAVIAFHVMDRLGRPYCTDGIELKVTPSIGISLFPQDGATVDELIKHADVAMYNAKQQGRDTFNFFTADLNTSSEEALRIESRLHKALELREFELYFQPVINLLSGATVAAEALVRWPAMGTGPDRFIPIAEMAGFMRPLGLWILKEACRLCRQWRDHGLPTFPVAINVSSTQFRQADFPETLLQIVRQGGLQPADIKLEVTESVLINNVEEAVGILRKIRDTGIHVALDDFGTGYSSLSYLTQLPIDMVKLDQSFIRDLGKESRSAMVVESIVALAQSLDLDVVAEGIETPEALAFLNLHHCPNGQGYLFSQPLPAREFRSWCTAHEA